MKSKTKIILLSTGCGILVWFIDALLDLLIFYPEGGNFFQLLIASPPEHELYIRLIILFIFISFGFLVGHLVQKNKIEQENLRITLQSIGDGVIATDTRGNIERMNEVAEQLTGWDIEQARGKDLKEVFDIINAQTKEPVENPVEEVLKKGKIVGLANDTLLKSKDGEEYQIADSAAPIRDENGLIQGVVLVFRDVTQKYKRKQALVESEKKFRTLVNQSIDAIVLHDENGDIIDINNTAEKMYGYSKDEFIGMNMTEIDPQFGEIAEEGYTYENLHYEEYEKFESKHRCKDGKLIPVEVVLSKVWIKNEEQIMGIVRDITERKEAERKIQYMNNLLRESQKIAHLGSWEMDHDDNNLIWSDETYNIFGVKTDEFDPSFEKFLEKVHPEDRDKVADAFSESLEQNSDGYEVEHRIFRENSNEIRYLFEKCEHIKDDSGQIQRSMGIVNDITERKRAERKLKKSRRRMETLLSNMPGMAYRCKNDEKWTMKFVSKGVLELTGYKPEDLLNNNEISYSEIIHPQDRQQVNQLVQTSLEKKKHFEIEYRIITKNENIKWVWERGKGILNEGDIIALEGFISDITARKRAKEQVEHLNSLLRAIRNVNQLIVQEEDVQKLMQKTAQSLIETRAYTNCAIALIDEETDKIHPTAQAGENIVENSWEITPDGKGKGPKCVKQALKGNRLNHITEDQHCETCEYISTESLENISTLSVPIFREEEIIGVILITIRGEVELEEREKDLLKEVAADLSFARTKIKAEKQLEQSEKRLRDIFENAPVGIFRTSLEGNALEANDEMARIIGCENAEEAIETYSDLGDQLYVNPNRRRKFIEKLKQEGEVKNFVYQAQRQNNGKLWISMNARIGEEENGSRQIIDGFAWDITARKNAEERVKEQLEEKKTLLRELSHRTKINMQTISSMLSLRSSKIENEQVKKELSEVEDKIYSMALVHNKLYQSDSLSEINLSSYIKDLVGHFGKAYIQETPTHIEFKMDLKPVNVLIDSAIPTGLALNELLSNAIEYAFEDQTEGEIQLSLRREEEQILIIIKDNGKGLPDDFSIEKDGGMGLNIVKGLIEGQLDGEINFKVDNGLEWELKYEDTLYEERV